MPLASVHVCYGDPTWSVFVDDDEVDRTFYHTKAAALYAAKSLAQRLDAEVVIHEAAEAPNCR